MQDNISSGTKSKSWFKPVKPRSVVISGSVLVLLLLLVTAIVLFTTLPDANVFNDRVERIFVENDALTTGEQVKLLEILAQSGTVFSDVLQGYRYIIWQS